MGWSVLLEEASPSDLPDPLYAYSELMPPPRFGVKPSGETENAHRIPGDEHGWRVSEYEERLELAPGLERVAREVLQEISELAHGVRSRIPRSLVKNNPAFPERLATSDAALARETFSLALPVAISKTQDDKGRTRWTLFGASHEGAGRAFWKSFDPHSGTEAPHEGGRAQAEGRAASGTGGGGPEAPREGGRAQGEGRAASGKGEADFRRWIAWTLRTDESALGDLHAAGIRVLPSDPDPDLPAFGWEPLPEFAQRLSLSDEEPFGDGGVRAIVTFRLFERLPRRVQEAYLAGGVRLLPCPHSLLFWGHAGYRALATQLPRAIQIPLLQLFPRSEDAGGFRIPQSGWLDEKAVDDTDGGDQEDAMRRRVRRPHRWEHDLATLDDPVTVALFSSHPDDLHLYGKPMAKNAQIWSEKFERLLDGPSATPEEIEAAALSFKKAGRWGYRFQWPPMTVGPREVYWHRPLLARMGEDGTPEVFPFENGPSGFLTAERAGQANVELWPRLQSRPEHVEAIGLTAREEPPPEPTSPGDPLTVRAPASSRSRGNATRNVRKLLEWPELLDAPLTPALARALLAAPRDTTLGAWLATLPASLRARIEPGIGPEWEGGEPLTYDRTATRDFEERYWSAIALLAEGDLRAKNVADAVEANVARLPPGSPPQPERQLELVGELLHRWYAERIAAHGMEGQAVCADHVFRWETPFDYSWSKSWRRSRAGETAERNVIVVIPGRDRSQAVILADHYDTAYMEDLYYPSRGGTWLRVAARGADDNASATAALQLAADALLPLSKAGRLARDIWLVHLTGEEFPADCLGARALSPRLVRRDLVLRTRGGRKVDLSGTRVTGAIVMDMIAHNAERARDVFQISPGEGAGAARLARTVFEATRAWNARTAEWNAASPERAKAGRFVRQEDPAAALPAFRHLPLLGEIRPGWDPRSALYNTDAQVFSDAGIPAVLLMENYELFRTGYHDSEDTIANIDLDYGAAVAAIAIEAAARAAS